ncbi:MAG: sigma-70 family RNA polymerase sigma factor, partial [Planctomycetota bacterium]|nr:sigma-70 family RNA polymerase sigma factor [Planctomycetota bacterium]
MDRIEEEIFALRGPAWRLACWIIGDTELAEDAVQEAFLKVWRARGELRDPASMRSWLLRIVANAARNMARGEERIKAREDIMARSLENPGDPAEIASRKEAAAALRKALDGLEDNLRLPLLLHHVEGLSYREIADVLDMPEGTCRKYVSRGIERLRGALSAAGFAAAAPMLPHLLGSGAAPPVPAGLAGRLAAIAREGAAAPASSAADGTAGEDPADGGSAGTAGGADAVGPGAGTEAIGTAGGANTTGATGAGAPAAAAKGGMAMRIMICAATALLTAAVGILVPEFLGRGNPPGTAGAKTAGGGGAEKPPAGESKEAEETAPAGSNAGKPPPSNPVTGREMREEVFEFTQKPKAEKQGDKWVITFTSKGKCDATVAIVDKDGKIVRHLASGVLGPNAPWPFQQNSLSQKIEWDGKDDFGKPAPAGCKVKVGLGLKTTLDKFFFDNPLLIGYTRDDTVWRGVACAREGNVFLTAAGGRCILLDREGRYVRTVWPPPATTMSPEKFPAIRFARRTDGKMVPVYSSWGLISLKSDSMYSPYGFVWYPPVITPDGKELLVCSTYLRAPRYLYRLCTDGTMPEHHMAVSYTHLRAHET